MSEIGDRLRQARESRGLSLAQAEEGTRIRRMFLEALEADEFDKLPPDVYARGFLRNYARFLGLDAEAMLKLYPSSRQGSATDIPRVLDTPLRVPPSTGIWRVIFWVVVVIAIVGLALWYGYNRFYDDVRGALRPVLPTATMGRLFVVLATATATPTSTSSPTRTGTPTHTATLKPTQALPSLTSGPVEPTPTMGAALNSTVTVSPTVVLTGTIAATPTIALEGGNIRVQAEVSQKTYVAVEIDGVRTMERVLDPGEDQLWVAQRSFWLRVGNAAGITLTVNGVQVPPLGKAGEVMNVEYTLDNLPSE